MYFDSCDGTPLYYEEHGNKKGRPIFLLHGWAISSVFFSEQIPPLVKNGYRVITWDWRGHGKSEWNGTLTKFKTKEELLEIMYDDFKTLVAHLEIDEPYGLIGHSAGAGIGLSIALANPEEVVVLGILNSSYVLAENFAEKAAWQVIPVALEAAFNPLFQIPYKMVLRGSVPLLSLALGKSRKTVKSWVEDFIGVKKRTVIEELKNLKQYNLLEEVSRLHIPCLIIAGQYDLLTPPKRSRMLHRHIPKSELHIIRNTGHLSMVERSKLVNKYIINFLKREYPPNRQAA
ncbi:MAG: alpha/beta hydrolase [Candidatus Helarchaeota archaeon]|nr:alpha/beta hydrolase [Candidatus Helarchaeota archaeon]